MRKLVVVVLLMLGAVLATGFLLYYMLFGGAGRQEQEQTVDLPAIADEVEVEECSGREEDARAILVDQYGEGDEAAQTEVLEVFYSPVAARCLFSYRMAFMLGGGYYILQDFHTTTEIFAEQLTDAEEESVVRARFDEGVATFR